ncbi:Alpha/beta hydrolase family protein [Rubripirellula amarantea]|uniref:Alpha/beta hydrolase family protein n=1 Tax=Rubripirellula amarantea TaxID=2527999 RepID=A0A5C5WHF2_9BACT|nr:PHB depolymerase family esterase [Rubripirellula amarantea]TWT50218.1 Alpha/beta hydrolase family protein [Rubripirellula amarantea]
MIHYRWLVVALALSTTSLVEAQTQSPTAEQEPQATKRESQQRTWQIDGVSRQAIIVSPASAKTDPTPLVFVFHGHGGNKNQVLRSYAIDKQWPEAIVVSPQGLNTPGVLTDPNGKRPGWQSSPGAQGDRDLKFFDAMLESILEDYKVDQQRIYATGHSNGASFTYLLWAVRGDTFAAVAPSSGAIRPDIRKRLSPKPAMIIAGESDPLVKFAWQSASIEFVKQLNQCSKQPKTQGKVTQYSSHINAPLYAYVHSGGHRFEKDAVPSMVEFFQDQSKPTPIEK